MLQTVLGKKNSGFKTEQSTAAVVGEVKILRFNGLLTCVQTTSFSDKVCRLIRLTVFFSKSVSKFEVNALTGLSRSRREINDKGGDEKDCKNMNEGKTDIL